MGSVRVNTRDISRGDVMECGKAPVHGQPFFHCRRTVTLPSALKVPQSSVK